MINYDYIHKSINFYEEHGFKRVESPWTVTSAISNITKPMFATDFSIVEKNKVLVASGEQSFLYLFLKGFLPNGSYQTVTPCFRNELFDEWHTKYFIKNELIKTDDVTQKQLTLIIELARDFFESIIEDDVDVIKTSENSFDLSYKNVELGSYGIRECSFLTWIYGTGVAEPRLSSVMRLKGINNGKIS